MDIFIHKCIGEKFMFYKKSSLKAFTLAEVLITLAIIGVVAAITIPSIVANHQKRALETQFAKAYRTLSQAVNLAIAEYGDISTWDWKDSYTAEEKDKFVKKYFSPYLNHVKFCSATNPNTGCFPDVMYKFMSGDNFGNTANLNDPKVQLADGSMISFTLLANTAPTRADINIYFDINGHKKPNTIGRDLFTFSMYKPTGEFLPSGVIIDGTYDEATNSYAKRTKEEALQRCKSSNSGNCAAAIVQDGFKMNY